MIKANELRVNNMVLVKGKVDVLHRVGDNDYISENQGHGIVNTDLEPIPLTEEILLKCGFVYEKERLKVWALGEFVLQWKYSISVIDCFFFVKSPYVVRIINLHELQNLYFALTNQELKIEL